MGGKEDIDMLSSLRASGEGSGSLFLYSLFQSKVARFPSPSLSQIGMLKNRRGGVSWVAYIRKELNVPKGEMVRLKSDYCRHQENLHLLELLQGRLKNYNQSELFSHF
jgi:hypothetical protein